MRTKRRTPASCAAASRLRVPLHHDALELLAAALADRDEVDDGVDALGGAAQAVRVGHVALDELGAPARALARRCGSRTSARTRRARGAKRADDMARRRSPCRR